MSWTARLKMDSQLHTVISMTTKIVQCIIETKEDNIFRKVNCIDGTFKYGVR